MRNVTKLRSRLSSLVLIVLVAAMLLSFAACGSKNEPADVSTPASPADVSTPATSAAGENAVGEGATAFTFEAVDAEGNTTLFTVNTDAETVGDALLENGLIAGEEGAYGLYVKTVNGITADYDTDGTYWAFYVNGEYATAGVDATEVEAGASYAFKVE